MNDFYSEMKDVMAELLATTAEGGLGQTGVALTRVTMVPPVNSWEMPTYTTKTIPLKAAARGVSQDYVGSPGINGVVVGAERIEGVVIVATDIEVVFAAPDGGVKAGDAITVNGQSSTLIHLETIPAAGLTLGYRAILRT